MIKSVPPTPKGEEDGRAPDKDLEEVQVKEAVQEEAVAVALAAAEDREKVVDRERAVANSKPLVGIHRRRSTL